MLPHSPSASRGVPDGAASSTADAKTMFAIWAFLLAAGTIFHQALATDWTLVSLDTLLALSALFVMARPSSLKRLLAMVSCHLVDLAFDLPFVTNHVVVQAIVELGFLTALTVASRRAGPVDGGRIYAAVAPALRASTLVMYVFAGLAKVNASFFDPALSSAVTLLRSTQHAISFIPVDEWAWMPVIWGTVILELGLPVILFRRATRGVGLIIALGFHAVMALSGHPSYSALAPAILFPFVPDDLPARLRRVAREFPRSNAAFQRLRGLAAHPAAFAVVGGGWLALSLVHTQGWISDKLFNAILYHPLGLKNLLLPYLAFFMAVIGADAWRRGSLRYPVSTLGMTQLLALTPLLMLGNGLCPYLGLKTQSSLTMYSNLQTEADQWNHLLLPVSMRIFDFQDELVRIVESNDAGLERAARKRHRWVFFEFHRYLSSHPDVSVTYEHAGETFVVARAGDHEVLSTPPPLAMRKALWFRGVAPIETNRHRH
ncbi:MAG: HTTM domain-containing protein [Myxococcales bacterium]|nr:HTTM domain-containing protein [Myxococcales bacterium]